MELAVVYAADNLILLLCTFLTGIERNMDQTKLARNLKPKLCALKHTSYESAFCNSLQSSRGNRADWEEWKAFAREGR